MVNYSRTGLLLGGSLNRGCMATAGAVVITSVLLTNIHLGHHPKRSSNEIMTNNLLFMTRVVTKDPLVSLKGMKYVSARINVKET